MTTIAPAPKLTATPPLIVTAWEPEDRELAGINQATCVHEWVKGGFPPHDYICRRCFISGDLIDDSKRYCYVGFNASFYQLRLGYYHLTGRPLPGNLTFDEAGNRLATEIGERLIQEYGRLRVEAVVTAVPNDPSLPEATALATAKGVDPGPAAT